jgi:hypothetical protein
MLQAELTAGLKRRASVTRGFTGILEKSVFMDGVRIQALTVFRLGDISSTALIVFEGANVRVESSVSVM